MTPDTAFAPPAPRNASDTREVNVRVRLSGDTHVRLAHIAALLSTSIEALVGDACSDAVSAEMERMAHQLANQLRGSRGRSAGRNPRVTPMLARDWKRRFQAGETCASIARSTPYNYTTVNAWIHREL